MKARAETISLSQIAIGSYLGKGLAYQYLGVLCFSSFLFADFYFVSRLGSQALITVSIAGPILLFILTFLLRFGNGVTVWIAQSEAKGNKIPALKVVVLMILIGMLFPILLEVGENHLLHVIQPDSLGSIGLRYIQLMGWALLVASILIALLSYAKGIGLHQLIFKSLAVLAGINLILDPILIFGLVGFPKMGLLGAAYASLTALFVAVIFTITQSNFYFTRIRIKQFQLSELKTPLKYGLPLAMVGILIPLRDGFGVALSYDLNQEALAAIGIGQRLDFGIQLFYFALVAAMVPFISQNYESKNIDRIRLALKYASVASALYVTIVVSILTLSSINIGKLFSAQEGVSTYLNIYLAVIPANYFLLGFVFIGNSWLTGLGRTKSVALIGIVSVISQIASMHLLQPFFGFYGLVLSYFCMSLVGFSMALFLLRKQIKSLFG